MSDWADERAEKVIDVLRIATRARAVDVLAAFFRVAECEGCNRGVNLAFGADDVAFKKVFGER